MDDQGKKGQLKQAAVEHVTKCLNCQGGNRRSYPVHLTSPNGKAEMIFPYGAMCPEGKRLYGLFLDEVYR